MASIVTTKTWVPLAEVMGYCNVGPERTREMEHLLNEVVDAIESEIERPVLTATYTNELYNGTGEGELFLRAWPVTTLTRVEFLEGVTDTTETWTEYHSARATAYVSERGKQSIYFRALCFPEGMRNVRVTYVAGYSKDGLASIPKVPQDLKTALKETALEWFKMADLQLAGLSSVRGPMGETTTYRERFQFPAHVLPILSRYRKLGC